MDFFRATEFPVSPETENSHWLTCHHHVNGPSHACRNTFVYDWVSRSTCKQGQFFDRIFGFRTVVLLLNHGAFAWMYRKQNTGNWWDPYGRSWLNKTKWWHYNMQNSWMGVFINHVVRKSVTQRTTMNNVFSKLPKQIENKQLHSLQKSDGPDCFGFQPLFVFVFQLVLK